MVEIKGENCRKLQKPIERLDLDAVKTILSNYEGKGFTVNGYSFEFVGKFGAVSWFRYYCTYDRQWMKGGHGAVASEVLKAASAGVR